MRRKPNFLLFITDQHRADFLGCYGHPIVKTPNIDSIAARGVAFDRFFVASPVCMPNRSSLMTGRMPSVHGVRCNGIPLTRDAVTFVDLLRDAGYSTALVGKSHLQNFTSLPLLLTPPAVPAGYYSPSEGLRSAIRNGFGDRAYMQEEPDFWAKENRKVATPFYGFDQVDLVTGHGSRSSPAASPRKAPDRRGRCRTSLKPSTSSACQSVPTPTRRAPGRSATPAATGLTTSDYGE